jgi:hypothetical protein
MSVFISTSSAVIELMHEVIQQDGQTWRNKYAHFCNFSLQNHKKMIHFHIICLLTIYIPTFKPTTTVPGGNISEALPNSEECYNFQSLQRIKPRQYSSVQTLTIPNITIQISHPVIKPHETNITSAVSHTVFQIL